MNDDNDQDDAAKAGGGDEAILEEALEMFDLCVEREGDNRQDYIDDVRFARLADQWPAEIRQARELSNRPCLTINKLPAVIRQVVNDARQNRPAMIVHPADSKADPETAKIMGGLIRNIEKSSSAPIAYDTAVDCSVTGGFGYWRIALDYACDDTFELDIRIKAVPDPLVIYGDPYSVSHDSADWNCAFVVDTMTKKQFERKYPDAEKVDWEMDFADSKKAWLNGDEVTVAEYWKREETTRKIIGLSDGQILDLEVFEARLEQGEFQDLEVIGQPRPVRSHKVTQYLMTGAEVLETTDWPGKFIPIVPVYGETIVLEGKRHLRSLVRDAKDPQRMFNFWRTNTTELVALAPRVPYIGPKGAFKSDAVKWATANTENHAYLEYDTVDAANQPIGQAPQRQQFASIPAGAIQEALNASDDIKTITGIHDASLGARSNETSGVAINARKIEGDVSTFHFIDNLSRGIEHTGRIIIDLIPHVYSTERVVRVIGEDEQPSTVTVNGAGPPEADGDSEKVSRIYDVRVGKYDLTVRPGPSFTSKRQEAAAQMVEFVRAYPQAAPVIGDLLAKNLDWPGADEIAKRLHALLPPQLQDQAGGEGGQGGQPDPQQLAMQQQQQAQMQQLVAAFQKLQGAYETLRQDKALETRKLDLEEAKVANDAFKLETERMVAQRESIGGEYLTSFG